MNIRTNRKTDRSTATVESQKRPEDGSRLTEWISSRRFFRLLFPVLGLLAFGLCLPADAQSYSIDWHKVAGGGGTSTGGVYSVSGTIGQHDAGGPLTGGNYSLTGGFWALFAVQTAGGPPLSIFLTTTNTAVVQWASPSTGFVLQENTNIAGTNWTTPPQTVQDNGTSKFIVVNPPAGNRFYRLFKP